MSEPSWARPARWLLPAIVLCYLILGTLYAAYTPAWQAPDEPAHYNYVRYLADRYHFPVLKPGDYPAAYLEEIKAAHFPPEMSIDPIRYEFHQPPLYYLLAVPVYRLFGGALLPLRLLSLAMGALLLLVVHQAVQVLIPGQPFLASATTAFIAFLPMHLAMTAALNNDTLAELLLATILLLAIRYLRTAPEGRFSPLALTHPQPPPSPKFEREGGPGGRRGSVPGEKSTPENPEPLPAREGAAWLLALLGITTGLGLLTKTSVYIALPLVLLTITARHLWLKGPSPTPRYLPSAVGYLLPALGLGLPWWLRNLVVYGNLDFLGLERHNQVVAGQLRTAEFIAVHSPGQLIHDLFLTSFHSFWGQFGWMGVLLDRRLYQALALFSALALVGFAAWAVLAWRHRASFPTWQRIAAGLLALSALLTLASYLWYNTQFVQHQGRYLFPALLPIGLAVALGWRQVLRRERALPVAALLLAGAAILKLTGRLPTWPLLMLGVVAAAFALRRFLPSRWDPLIHIGPYLLLLPLDLACLLLFIVPQLAR